ncbi:MAG: hypothetical protein EOO89_29155 [Pedobacter sp.]|nr:MAG: hypothetical protein EOO89_29155 [Pedobacter sp.]
MKNPATKMSADLVKFIEKFEPAKFKEMANGIEIRGISNIHRSIADAEELIARLKLKLTVEHNAQMVSYGAFEVNAL